ncbi:MAG: SIMPL domain-containing protein [Gammaproteobacteria bacterium]|nr:SIMPL domain-containing protein [Gammaproteobacteria bacterium]
MKTTAWKTSSSCPAQRWWGFFCNKGGIALSMCFGTKPKWRAGFFFALLAPGISMAADSPTPSRHGPGQTRIHLSASADYRVPDTELHVTLSAEAQGTDPASLAAQVNQKISWATTRVLPTVHGPRWHTGGYTTLHTGIKTAPWRVQESIAIQNSDPSSLLPLLGTLQSRLQLESLDFTPAPEDLRKAENRASVTALQRFRTDAARDCKALGFVKTPRLGEIDVQKGPHPYPVRPFPVLMAARAMPGPVPANPGSSHGSVTANGTVSCR